MIKLWTALPLAALLSSSAFAQASGDPAAGRALATRVCASCHNVAPGETATASSGAPAFAAIANTNSTTEIALHAFLSSPHANMPNLILNRREQDDVIAYILSMRTRP